MGSAVPDGLPVVPISARCACSSRRTLPLRLVSDTLTELRGALAGTIHPSTPVLTYRCRYCKSIVVLRARDLFLTSEADVA